MHFVVLHPSEAGVTVLLPAPGFPVEQVARKDVPAGVPFLIVPQDALPSGFDYMAAWEVDFSAPHGFGIGHEAWFAEQAAKEAA